MHGDVKKCMTLKGIFLMCVRRERITLLTSLMGPNGTSIDDTVWQTRSLLTAPFQLLLVKCHIKIISSCQYLS